MLRMHMVVTSVGLVPSRGSKCSILCKEDGFWTGQLDYGRSGGLGPAVGRLLACQLS